MVVDPSKYQLCSEKAGGAQWHEGLAFFKEQTLEKIPTYKGKHKRLSMCVFCVCVFFSLDWCRTGISQRHISRSRGIPGWAGHEIWRGTVEIMALSFSFSCLTRRYEKCGVKQKRNAQYVEADRNKLCNSKTFKTSQFFPVRPSRKKCRPSHQCRSTAAAAAAATAASNLPLSK